MIFKKKIPLYVLFITLFFCAIFTVLFGGFVRHILFGGTKFGALTEPIMIVASFPALANQAIIQLVEGPPQVIGDRFPDIDGFKKSGAVQTKVVEDEGYLLLSSYDKKTGQSTVQLIRIKDQSRLHEWVPDIDELVATNKDFEISGSGLQIINPLLLEDGGLVFHMGDSYLFKVGPCSKVKWSASGKFHHSIERDEEGNYWSPTVMEPSGYEGVLNHRDDGIAKISPTGKVLFKKSVAKILEENGYRGLLAAGFNEDPIHLNDIEPALTDTKFWKKGDLLLSLRHLSTIVQYRPSTDKIIWLKTGPWMNQHDPDFVNESEITVFGNNVIDNPKISKFGSTSILVDGHNEHSRVMIGGHNEIYRYDFSDDSLSIPYSLVLKAMDVRTPLSGTAEVLPDGDVYVDETDFGRLLRLSPTGAKWEFVARLDETHVSSLAMPRYLTEGQVSSILPRLKNTSCGNEDL